MKLTIKAAKAGFLDRKAVEKAIGKNSATMLRRQGAYLRKTARSGMKKRQGSSRPGDYPHRHGGQLYDYLFYAWDPAEAGVVVGSVQLGKSQVPQVLRDGGKTKEFGVYNRRGQFVPLRLMSPKGRAAAVSSGRVVAIDVKVAARPYMDLATKDSQPALTRIANEYFPAKR